MAAKWLKEKIKDLWQILLREIHAAGLKFHKWQKESWAVNSIKIAGIVIVVVNAIFGVLEKRDEAAQWLGWDLCHLYDPATGKPDKHLPTRPCLSGRVTFIKWWYPFKDDTVQVDRPDRVFQVASIQNGQIEWEEEQLLGLGGEGKEIWSGPRHYFEAVENGELVPSSEMIPPNDPQWVTGDSGFVLRRIDISDDNCDGAQGEQPSQTMESAVEFFIQNAAAASTTNSRQFVFMRILPTNCDQAMGNEFYIGPHFVSGFQLTQALEDP